MTGVSSGYVESLPENVKRRVVALQDLQVNLHYMSGMLHGHEIEPGVEMKAWNRIMLDTNNLC